MIPHKTLLLAIVSFAVFLGSTNASPIAPRSAGLSRRDIPMPIVYDPGCDPASDACPRDVLDVSSPSPPPRGDLERRDKGGPSAPPPNGNPGYPQGPLPPRGEGLTQAIEFEKRAGPPPNGNPNDPAGRDDPPRVVVGVEKRSGPPKDGNPGFPQGPPPPGGEGLAQAIEFEKRSGPPPDGNPNDPMGSVGGTYPNKRDLGPERRKKTPGEDDGPVCADNPTLCNGWTDVEKRGDATLDDASRRRRGPGSEIPDPRCEYDPQYCNKLVSQPRQETKFSDPHHWPSPDEPTYEEVVEWYVLNHPEWNGDYNSLPPYREMVKAYDRAHSGLSQRDYKFFGQSDDPRPAPGRAGHPDKRSPLQVSDEVRRGSIKSQTDSSGNDVSFDDMVRWYKKTHPNWDGTYYREGVTPFTIVQAYEDAHYGSGPDPNDGDSVSGFLDPHFRPHTPPEHEQAPRSLTKRDSFYGDLNSVYISSSLFHNDRQFGYYGTCRCNGDGSQANAADIQGKCANLFVLEANKHGKCTVSNANTVGCVENGGQEPMTKDDNIWWQEAFCKRCRDSGGESDPSFKCPA